MSHEPGSDAGGIDGGSQSLEGRVRDALPLGITVEDYDQLTGLLRRRGLVERLRSLLEAQRGGGRTVGCMVIDLDHMQCVNAIYGHLAGDHVLREVSRRLLEAAPPPHAVACFGGDEFVVVLVDVTDLEAATVLAENVLLTLRRPMESLPVEAERVTASIGVTVASIDDAPDDVLGRADHGTFTAKRDGRDRVVAVPTAAGRGSSG